MASWPMTVWWSNTEFSPLPTANRDSLSSPASSRASPLATAWVPVAAGSSLSTLRPTSVRSLGLSWTTAPKSRIISPRMGF